ncbi:MAG: hypothetical protein GKS06_06120 [Acidobacteria bacterium]|nr:hypothetical protein [Acidobacteriota bacterium]
MLERVRVVCLVAAALVLIASVGRAQNAGDTHRVIVNNEGSHDVQPIGQALLEGWRAEGFVGSLHDCIVHLAVARLSESRARADRSQDPGGTRGTETYGRLLFNDANDIGIAGVGDRVPVALGDISIPVRSPKTLFVLLDPSGVGEIRQYVVPDDDGSGSTLEAATARAVSADEAANAVDESSLDPLGASYVELFNLTAGIMDADFNFGSAWRCADTAETMLFRAEDPARWARMPAEPPAFRGWEPTGWSPEVDRERRFDDTWILYAYCPEGFEPES